MSYILTLTNGTILTTLIDGTTDDTTDLTLIGKNFTGYGEQLNENFVHLLENFAGVASPTKPIVGQLWFDAGDGRMKVYTSTGWRAAGGPIVTDVEPLNFNTGDLWVDNNEDQLYFFTGSDLVLAGPIWKKSQGKTGFVANTLFDSSGNAKSVLFLYVSNSLLGIYSAEAFTPYPPLAGFSSLIKGYNTSSNVASIFSGTSSNSLQLNNLLSTQFMRSDAATINSQKILIQNNQGMTIGANQIANFYVEGNTLVLENISATGSFIVKTKDNVGVNYPIYVDGSVNRVGIYTTAPQYPLDVNGDLRVRGNLIVDGSNTTINSTTLQVDDKNIELAVSLTPTDSAADGGGITIYGTTNKTILFKNSTQSFDLSENLNLASGKVIRIGGVEVLSGNTLSSAITSAPGITAVGPQVSLIAGNISIVGNIISSTATNQDIELNPLGSGNVVLPSRVINNVTTYPRITGLGYPLNDGDATPKFYVDNISKVITPISLTLIDNGLTGAINNNCILLLNDVANPIFFVDNKIAYIHIQHLGAGSPPAITRYLKRFKIQNGAWVFDSDLNSSLN